MTDLILRCSGLGKRYRIGERPRYHTLREWLATAFRTRGGWTVNEAHEIWSLRNLDVEVTEGELVGIIGSNGAGKSTLLRIIAGITEPTEGRVAIRGRVGSLLEVGTGFHPELTGRDNIYLSGAILGMSRRNINTRFDEIVAFAEIERFLETPVKRYSSGMYMRLAFAVAAHLDTELLLVDELLAVGDASFQRKCVDTMGNLARRRRTLLFVSHDLGSVQRLCQRTLLLERGRLVADGPTDEVIGRYMSAASQSITPEQRIDLRDARRGGSGEARFVSLTWRSPDPRFGGHLYCGGPLEVVVDVECSEGLRVGCAELFICDHRGIKLIDVDGGLLGRSWLLPEGRSQLRFCVAELPLNPGIYQLGLWMARTQHDRVEVDHVDAAVRVEILAGDTERLFGYSSAYGPVACTFDVQQIIAGTEQWGGAPSLT